MTKKKKTTMSVPEMQRLLGLGKTDAYSNQRAPKSVKMIWNDSIVISANL